MHYFIKTYGCQMNISDSERIVAVLEALGWKPANKEEKADLFIINVCSVRQRAVDRVYGKLADYRKKFKSKVVLTGCLMPQDKKKLKDKVDLIFEIKDLMKLPGMLADLFNKSTRINYSYRSYFKIIPKYQSSVLAYVPISTGCNKFCSYCVVPYTRGRETYRPVSEIITEIKDLVKKGYKEIVLLGQNVNSYQSKIQTKNKLASVNFSKLLRLICEISGDFKISFLTSHPKDVSQELIETIAECKKIKKEIHLPLQSGDDEILRKMNRGYSSQDYERLIQRIRAKVPEIKISTDLIVGFPGESRKQFENTLRLCKKLGFNKAYIAKYSPRPGTAASYLEDDVPEKEKKYRWKVLENLINPLVKKSK